jgi:hypothetical protein
MFDVWYQNMKVDLSFRDGHALLLFCRFDLKLQISYIAVE